MTDRETGRVAVVTGAASGIGAAVCARLARQGCRIAALDLDADAAETLAGALRDEGHDAIACFVDVADRDSIDRAYGVAREALGPIEILVTSAAVSGFVPFEALTLEAWERTIAVNLTGTFHCIQAAIPDMAEAGWGRVVTLSSAAGQSASPRQADYSASKGGVIALTKTIAVEYGARGVTVNSVAPFAVDTPLLRAQQENDLLPPDKVVHQMIPAGRMASTDEIASMCAYLCSEDAGYVTGQIIGVNGGALT